MMTKVLFWIQLVVIASAGEEVTSLQSAPCYGKLNFTFPFEEVCYKTVFNGTNGLSLREYDGAELETTLITNNASSSITTYQEALTLTTFYVIEYLVGEFNVQNKSLLNARTVPLVLRPPTAENNEWLSFMALAPSKFPPKSNPPKPTEHSGVVLKPLGSSPVTLAVLRADLTQDPQPSDFDTLCKKLEAGVKSQLPAWKIDSSSPFTFSHARYYTEIFFGSYWTCECWAAVSKA